MKLFCTFAFDSSTYCIQIEDDWLIKSGCIEDSVFLNRYSCVSLQCPVLSLVMTILSFLFMLRVGIV